MLFRAIVEVFASHDEDQSSQTTEPSRAHPRSLSPSAPRFVDVRAHPVAHRRVLRYTGPVPPSAITRFARPVWRTFAPKFFDRAVAWVKAGGHAAVVTSPSKIELFMPADASGEITEAGRWSVLALEQQRFRRVKDGAASGLYSARVQPHATEAVLDWCERDSIHEGPTRKMQLDCLDCGACCVDANVILDPDDLERFDEAGRPDLKGKAYIKRAKDGKVTLRFLPDGRCQHLLADLRCHIYPIRPFNCRVFPVGSEACLAARESTLGLRDGAPALEA